MRYTWNSFGRSNLSYPEVTEPTRFWSEYEIREPFQIQCGSSTFVFPTKIISRGAGARKNHVPEWRGSEGYVQTEGEATQKFLRQFFETLIFKHFSYVLRTGRIHFPTSSQRPFFITNWLPLVVHALHNSTLHRVFIGPLIVLAWVTQLTVNGWSSTVVIHHG